MVIKMPWFWPMAICSFFGSRVSLSFIGLWGGPFLMHVYGMSRTQAGAVLSMFAIGLIVGSPFMSWLSDRVFRSRKKVLMLNQFSALCVFYPACFFYRQFPNEYALCLVFLLTALCCRVWLRCRLFSHQGIVSDTDIRHSHRHDEHFPLCRSRSRPAADRLVSGFFRIRRRSIQR